MTVRRRSSEADRGPCLFVVARGTQPTAPPVRVELGRHRELVLRRGDALDVAARRGEPAIELALPDAKISGEHARLEQVLGRWSVRDERSKNGTFVNGARVDRAILADGDTLDAGDTIFVFREALPLAGELAHHPAPGHGRGLASLLPAIQASLDELVRMAASPLTILVEGETGTGKEVVAAAVHARSGRPGALIPVNCGALPAERVEAELFGWRRGAFPGATADHAGLVRAADRGTLFLDEIGDLPLAEQAALLRVLQPPHQILPIGGAQPIAVDVRAIAATHRPLDAMCAAGTFREDLLARLAGYRLRLPPLRERREDLGLFLADLLGRGGAAGHRVTIAALRALLRHTWPTNIRELEQVISRALITAARGVIDADDLRGLGAPAPAATPAPAPRPPAPDDPRYRELVALLREHRGNVAAVARAMSKARMQIQRWLRRYGLDPDEYRG